MTCGSSFCILSLVIALKVATNLVFPCLLLINQKDHLLDILPHVVMVDSGSHLGREDIADHVVNLVDQLLLHFGQPMNLKVVLYSRS